MFLRSTLGKKDGKTHRYFRVVENRRLNSGQVAQRTVLYLGEINDQQQHPCVPHSRATGKVSCQPLRKTETAVAAWFCFAWIGGLSKIGAAPCRGRGRVY